MFKGMFFQLLFSLFSPCLMYIWINKIHACIYKYCFLYVAACGPRWLFAVDDFASHSA